MSTATVEPAAAPAPDSRAHSHSSSNVSTGGVIASEWIKLRSLRSSWLTLAAAVLGMIGVGWLVSFETNSHWSHMQPDELLTFDPVSRSLTGVYLAQLAIGVLGVLVITGEYATGMIRATLSAVPRRLPVLWAKLGVFSTVTFALMVVSSFAAFVVGQRLLGSHGTTLSSPHAQRAVIGVALYLTVVAVLAIGLGFIIRSTAGGIAALFGLLLVLPAIGHVLPSTWQQHILPYLPSNAGGALYTLRPDPGTLAPWTGFGVMCLWAVVAVISAGVLLRRRDA
jgi:ABC-2 type transport system permease protein